MPLQGSFESSQQNKSQNRVKSGHSEQHFTHFPTKKITLPGYLAAAQESFKNCIDSGYFLVITEYYI